ncbi:sporulation integral membrane protein YtvI [Cerasibacillus terrae]|uniref:Sporulation integral membrane protein YtvI n=2 Tax=Cerasibacillus terrae TaxID=2498845 RepID=A0A5C8NN33_9BACI|nr:sporulation integral membrane protein YtvI [Cerasibacillus terrae]
MLITHLLGGKNGVIYMYKQIVFGVLRSLLILCFVFCFFFFMKWFISYTYPFLLAIVIAYVIHPIVTAIEKGLHLSRSIATILTMASALIVFFGLFILIFSEFIQGLIYLADETPTYYQFFIQQIDKLTNQYLLPYYEKLITVFQTFHPQSKIFIEDSFQQLINYLLETGTNLLQDTFSHIPVFLSFVPSSIIIFFVVMLASFFFIKDWYFLKRKLAHVVPASLIYKGNQFITHFKKACSGYVKAQGILVGISAMILFIGLSLLQIKHAFTITVVAAITDILPLIGTGIIFIPWVVYTFLTENYPLTIGLSILYGIIVISRQILEPKIMATSIGINPLLAIFVLFITWQIWGASSIIFTPIILIILTVFMEIGLFSAIWNFIKGT